MLADVGLLGMPNAGKSTLIAAISNARPKIADYPFTTLHPNLGVVRVAPEQSFVVADIPGLIEGASEGAGLGHQFLRHLQRTRLLLHLVDFAPFDDSVDPVAQARAIVAELKKYDPALHDKPRWLVLNKLDMVPADERAERVKDFVKRLRWKGPVFADLGADARRLRAAGPRGLRARRGAGRSRPPKSPIRASIRSTPAAGAHERACCSGARRIVVKVGSSLVTNEGRGVDAEAIGNWCRQMAALARAGARGRDGLQRRDRRGHEAPRLGGAAARKSTSCRPPPRSARWAWRRSTRRSCASTAWAAPRCC